MMEITNELVYSALVYAMTEALGEDGNACEPPTFNEFMDDEEYASETRVFLHRFAKAIATHVSDVTDQSVPGMIEDEL